MESGKSTGRAREAVKIFRPAVECPERHASGEQGVLRAIVRNTYLPTLRVAPALGKLRLKRGLPVRIVIDNGNEFASEAR
jgi:hypothetical protein